MTQRLLSIQRTKKITALLGDGGDQSVEASAEITQVLEISDRLYQPVVALIPSLRKRGDRSGLT